MATEEDTTETATGMRQRLRNWRTRAGERWLRHGRPLVDATREAVRDARATPREELERERYVKVGEAHLKRLLADQVARSPKILSADVDLHEGHVQVRAVVRRWREVTGETQFRLQIGHEDDAMIEVGIRRTGPSRVHSGHWLMNLLVRLWMAWAVWRGDPDPFDHFLLKLRGARRDGETIYVPIDREPLTARVGKSRVLRRLAAYATVSSLEVKPGELVVGYHLGRLANRMADMYVLRHLLRETGNTTSV